MNKSVAKTEGSNAQMEPNANGMARCASNTPEYPGCLTRAYGPDETTE
jgi:hypothetical protein